MIQLNVELKNDIINKLEEIISINNSTWIDLDTKIKIKLIHHYCNFICNNKLSNDICNNDIIRIPLKSLKPKNDENFEKFLKKLQKTHKLRVTRPVDRVDSS